MRGIFKYILGIISFFILCFFLSFGIDFLMLRDYNQTPLNIKTFDRSDSPYHPSVLYFEEGWNGYKYWMVETPYNPYAKPYRDRYECPCIHVSNDGENWTVCDKSSFPLDDLSEEEIKDLDYFSDPCLVFVNNTLECWYRITRRDGLVENHSKNISLCRKVTKDGFNWTEREYLINFSLDNENQLEKEDMMLSPSVLYKNGEYILYYVFSEGNERNVCFMKSRDVKNWSNIRFCSLLNFDNECVEVNPWHISVCDIKDSLYLICYELGKDISLFVSDDGDKFFYKKQLLTPSKKHGSFYFNGLYQACLVKDDKYKLYFSADNVFHTFLGLMEGDDVMSMEVVSCGDDVKFSSFWEMIKSKYFFEKRRIIFILKNALS